MISDFGRRISEVAQAKNYVIVRKLYSSLLAVRSNLPE